MAATFRTAAAVLALLVLAGPVWATAPAGEAPAPSGSGAPGPSGSAAPAPGGTGTGCAISGFTPPRGEAASTLRTELEKRNGNDIGGTRLERAEAWLIPPDSRPIVVVDSPTPLTSGRAEVYLFGVGFPLESGSGEPRQRYVSVTSLPYIGSTVRVVGVRGESGACVGTLVVIADRSVFDTAAGRAGLATAALFGALMLWLARRRPGGWGRRFALAAPFGLLAGAGEAVVLQESAMISPFSEVGWTLPVLGLLLAAVLPLTRRRRPPAPPAETPWVAPGHVALPGLRVDAPFARTAAGQVDRATRADTGERVLVKTVRSDRAHDGAAALRLAREAEVAGGLDDPHCLRLLEDRPALGPDGSQLAAPVLIFEDVDGVPARDVLARRGPLTGPQACVVLEGALRGLAAVHAAGLVHRDVRPDNLFLGADGRILLAGFEVAAPGAQNAVVAEAEPPYAGPQQRSGAVIDRRADLWAAGAVLGELLTGQVPPFPVHGLPEPIAALIQAATADDPDARPPTAEAMRTAVVAAAERSYGPDWMNVGALTGAVLLPGGVIVAGALTQGVIGAAGAGGTATTGATGAAATGAAGVGAAGAGATGAAGVGAAGAGAAGAGAAGAGAAGAAGTTASKVGALVTPVLVVAAVGLSGAVEADPGTNREVITPEAARVIFTNTITEVRSGSMVHLADEYKGELESRSKAIFAGAPSGLDAVEVGVPRGQVAYPAYFWATGRVRNNEGTTHLTTRFERGAVDLPWIMTQFSAWPNRTAAPLKLAPDGYLAPVPAVGDLIVDPARLPTLYLDWFVRSEAADAVVPDPLLTPENDDSFLKFIATSDSFGESVVRSNVSVRYSGHRPGAVRGDLIPYADGTVLVTFEAFVHQEVWNAPGQVVGPCDTVGWFEGDDGVRYNLVEVDLHFRVQAWIPVRGGTFPSGPAPSVSGSAAPRPIPVSADRVTVDDEPSYQDFTKLQKCP